MSTAALLADIGGTNARFAIAGGARPGEPLVLHTRDFPDLAAALSHALAALGAASVDAVAVCAAGPPRDGAIRLTNCPWEVSEAALAAATGAGQVLLVNDFTAMAAALPALGDADLHQLGGGRGAAGEARAVIGPGTGLGMSACVPGPAGDALVTGEGGHADLAASCAADAAVVERLRERFGHVSAERVLCGDGLLNLYRALYPDDAPPPDAPALAARAAAGDGPALECVRRWSRWLGAVAGNLALTVGARSGVYVGGGIVPAWGELFPVSAFREGFEDKGRYRDYLAAIPTYMITRPFPALVGLSRLLDAGRAARE